MLSKEAREKLIAALAEGELERESEVLAELLEPPSEEKVQEWVRLADERRKEIENEQTKNS